MLSCALYWLKLGEQSMTGALASSWKALLIIDLSAWFLTPALYNLLSPCTTTHYKHFSTNWAPEQKRR